MEDRYAREGTLIRCNENRDRTLDDLECANARRAAAAIALRLERDRREALEEESERKIAELRQQVELERARAAEAAERAAAEAEAAYEAQWAELQRASENEAGTGALGPVPGDVADVPATPAPAALDSPPPPEPADRRPADARPPEESAAAARDPLRLVPGAGDAPP